MDTDNLPKERTHVFLDRMRRSTRDRALGAIMTLATLNTGCGGKEENSAEETPGTLAFTTKDPEKGLLSGTFESDEHAINFEIARREANPTEESDPNTPRYAIDGRICDENKFCFAQQAGGHAFADPDWVPDESKENPPDDENAARNFKTAHLLHLKLLESGKDDFAGLEEEYQTLENISDEPADQWTTSPPEENAPALNPYQKSVSALTTAETNNYKHHFEIHAELLYYLPSPILPGILPPLINAWHSSTYTQVFTAGGAEYSRYETCNHGACAKSIPKICSRDFPNRPRTIPINVSCADPATTGTKHPQGYANCCTTPYNILPGNVSHVCNDDTHLQRDMMIAGAPVNQSYCSDTITAGQPPACQ